MKLIIDIPNEGYDWIKNGFPDNEDKEFLIEAVKNSTPYEERPQGHWVRDINPYNEAYQLKCSVCGKWGGLTERGYNHESNFCSNCGAQMQKGGTV